MTARLTRLFAAAMLLSGGIVHLHLWNGGYRYIPRIGPLFLANFVGSIALAGAVIVSRRAGVNVAGIAFAGASLVALILSRTVGLFGFTEMIWTPDAVKTLAAELGAITTLGFTLFLQSGHPVRLQPRTTR
jgi:hypothetical protein